MPAVENIEHSKTPVAPTIWGEVLFESGYNPDFLPSFLPLSTTVHGLLNTLPPFLSVLHLS
jgi:hypothetical protein